MTPVTRPSSAPHAAAAHMGAGAPTGLSVSAGSCPAYLLIRGFRDAVSARAAVLRLARAVEARGFAVGLVAVG